MGLTFLANYTISKNIENMGFITNSASLPPSSCWQLSRAVRCHR
jgi:hypothetical protein